MAAANADDILSTLMDMDVHLRQGDTAELEEKKQALRTIFQTHPGVINQLYGGLTLLHTAIAYGFQSPIIQFLLEQGAHPDIATEQMMMNGETPLIHAVLKRNIPVVHVLLQYGADPDLPDKIGKSAMDHAKEIGNQEIIALLSSPLHFEKNKNKGRSQNQLNRNHRNELQKMISKSKGGKRHKSHRRRATIRRSKTHRRRR